MISDEIKREIKTAEKYTDTYLYRNSCDELMYAVYYLPPFGESMFYAKIYRDGNKFTADYARTEYRDNHGLVSYSREFASAEKADSRRAESGAVICGRCIFDNDIIGKLEQTEKMLTGSANIRTEKRIMIDGTSAALIIYKNGMPYKAAEISDRINYPENDLRKQFFEIFSKISDSIGKYREQ